MKQIIITLILLFSMSSSMYADPLKAYRSKYLKDMNKMLKEKGLGVTIVMKEGKYGLQQKGQNGNKSSLIIPCEYESFLIDPDNKDMLRFTKLFTSTETKNAYYNIENNTVLPERYLYVQNIYNSRSSSSINIKPIIGRLFRVQSSLGGPIGLFDCKENKEIVPAQYDNIWMICTLDSHRYQPSNYVLLRKNHEYTVYNWVYNYTISVFHYDKDNPTRDSDEDIVLMAKDTYIICHKSSHLGYYGDEVYNWRKKEITVPAKYTIYYDSFLSNDTLKIYSNFSYKYYGYYDLKRKKEIVPPHYIDIKKTVNPRYMWVSKTKEINTFANNPASLYDVSSQQEINLSSYSKIQFIKGKEMLWVEKSGLWGVYDLNKKSEIIPTKYNKINLISETDLFLCQSNQFYAVNKLGQTLIPLSRGYTNIEFQNKINNKYITAKFKYRTGRYYGECDRYGNELSRKEIVTFESTWTSTTDNAISFHISNVRINHLPGHKIEAICWISDADKKPLKDTNNKYCTKDGHVSVHHVFDIEYTNSIIKPVGGIKNHLIY